MASASTSATGLGPVLRFLLWVPAALIGDLDIPLFGKVDFSGRFFRSGRFGLERCRLCRGLLR